MKRKLYASIILFIIYALFTISLLFVDRKTIGPNESIVGYACINGWFHNLTGVHWMLYLITDWGGIPPIVLGICFGCLGLSQWIKRRHLRCVDGNLFILGGFYLVVFLLYLFFDFIVVNQRPVLINGYLEASYPSSTTLLSITFLGSANYPINKYIKNNKLKIILNILLGLYMIFLIIGRLISGVHWLTDIVGSCLLGDGLILLYEYLIIKSEHHTLSV